MYHINDVGLIFFFTNASLKIKSTWINTILSWNFFNFTKNSCEYYCTEEQSEASYFVPLNQIIQFWQAHSTIFSPQTTNYYSRQLRSELRSFILTNKSCQRYPVCQIASFHRQQKFTFNEVKISKWPRPMKENLMGMKKKTPLKSVHVHWSYSQLWKI